MRLIGLISNDSGLAHLSALVGCRTLVLWGAGDPSETLPWGRVEAFYPFNKPGCWPCVRNQCSVRASGGIACLKQYTQPDGVARVFAQIQDWFLPEACQEEGMLSNNKDFSRHALQPA